MKHDAYETKIVRMLVKRYENPGPQRNPRPVGVIVGVALLVGLAIGLTASLLENDVLTPFEGCFIVLMTCFLTATFLVRFSARLHAPAIAPYVDVAAARARLAELEGASAADRVG